jgi:uncharacterized membrane protein
LLVLSIVLVILSGLIHSIWNLFAKQSINKNVFLWFCQVVAIVFFLPMVIMKTSNFGSVPTIGWFFMTLSMTLHGVYVLFLARTYTAADLSQAYPIMRGISPLLVPIIGVLILNENLDLLDSVGIAAVVLGILMAGNFHVGNFSKQDYKTVFLAIGVGV